MSDGPISSNRRRGRWSRAREPDARLPAAARLASALLTDRSATALLGFALVGLAISAYLTTVHYANVPLVCSATGVVDCSAVTTSSYSVIPATSVPITVPGMVWFLVSGALALLAMRRATARLEEPPWLRGAHLGWAVLGLATVLYLVWVEAVQLHRLCEWCTGVHVLVVATLLVALWRWQRMVTPPPPMP